MHPYYNLPTHFICLPETFSILQHLANHHHIFSLPDQFPIKLSLIILKHFVLSEPIYPFLKPSIFCCNRYSPLPQFFNSNTHVFTLKLYFRSTVWDFFFFWGGGGGVLKSFLRSLILLCNLLLNIGSFLPTVLLIVCYYHFTYTHFQLVNIKDLDKINKILS